ncbi:tetratricopeptide repeat protein [Marinimicrobium locisalis]|uniref:tetratricopeptide repeat protein n=1 Tax=Marinimicrobium locisalis TaxID=546022 RepID=UPI003221EDA1
MLSKNSILFVALFLVSGHCLSGVEDESYKELVNMITDKNRIDALSGYVESIENDLPVAENGDASAMYRLYKDFNLLANIYGIDEAFPLAIKWLRKSVELDYPEALETMGHLYKSGDENLGVEKNLRRASEYFKSAWDKGDTSAGSEYRYIVECELPDDKAWDC